MIYTGIGSRETPQEIQEKMVSLAMLMGKYGHLLRSGGADGADSAFEYGCDRVKGPKNIFIPWNGFSGRRKHDDGVIVGVCDKALEIASQFHPNWSACSQGARALHARNVYQVLGVNLNEPSDLVICWTKNGSGAGGTGQAIRIARHFNIPIYDMGKKNWEDELSNFILSKKFPMSD